MNVKNVVVLKNLITNIIESDSTFFENRLFSFYAQLYNSENSSIIDPFIKTSVVFDFEINEFNENIVPENIFLQLSFVMKMIKFYFEHRDQSILDLINKFYREEDYIPNEMVETFSKQFLKPALNELVNILTFASIDKEDIYEDDISKVIENIYYSEKLVSIIHLNKNECINLKMLQNSFFDMEIVYNKIKHYEDEFRCLVKNHNLVNPIKHEVINAITVIEKNLGIKGIAAILEISNNNNFINIIYNPI